MSLSWNSKKELEAGKIKVYTFDLCGYLAHFRRRYTTASALTYYLPPLTTVMGIIANILGYERDTYYEDLSSEHMSIAIACKKEARKIVQTLNLLKVEGKSFDYDSSQTEFEFLLPKDDYLCYRIWFTAPRKHEEVLDSIFQAGRYTSRGTSISLGPAYALGWLENLTILEGNLQKGAAPIYSALPLQEIFINDNNKILKEDSFRNFTKDREPFDFMTILYDIAGASIKCNTEYIELESGENIVWLSSTTSSVKNPG